MSATDLELYGLFFMNDKAYYLKQLEKYRTGKRLSFNFSVVGLGIIWFIYRKLYRESLIISIIIAGITALNFLLLAPYLGNGGKAIFFLLFAFTFWAILGSIANRLYIKKAESVIISAKSNFEDTVQITNEVSAKGGVNAIGVFTALVIVFIILWLSSK